MNPPVAMTIAGSDSGGGAGIQADLKTFAALGRLRHQRHHRADRAEHPRRARGARRCRPTFVVAQIETVLADLPVAAVKTGMLATAPILRAVAALAAAGRLPRLVVDPVMVSSSGDRLLDAEAERALRRAAAAARDRGRRRTCARRRCCSGGRITTLGRAARRGRGARRASARRSSWSRAATR